MAMRFNDMQIIFIGVSKFLIRIYYGIAMNIITGNYVTPKRSICNREKVTA